MTNVALTEDLKLLPCPFCGGAVQFHKDDDCQGCHNVWCGKCGLLTDFSYGEGLDHKTLDELEALIVPRWNKRVRAGVAASPDCLSCEDTGYAMDTEGNSWPCPAPGCKSRPLP